MSESRMFACEIFEINNYTAQQKGIIVSKIENHMYIIL